MDTEYFGINEKELLINAIIGGIAVPDEALKNGLAQDCGNQWNSDFRWNRNKLEELDLDHLISIYNGESLFDNGHRISSEDFELFQRDISESIRNLYPGKSMILSLVR